jgi:hypothetical protein
MNLSQLSDDELKQAKMDTERAYIVSFRDVPTLRKLITAFEDDLRENQEADREATALSALGMGNKYVRA